MEDENKTNQLGFAEANEVLGSQGPLNSTMKGRKSIGRRVSFAATAKVRLFEKGATDKPNGFEEDDAKEDQWSSSNNPETPASPIRAPGTPTSKLPQVLSPQLPSRIPVRSPLTKSPRLGKNAKSPRSPASSFEIDLAEQSKADDNNSVLSSFEDTLSNGTLPNNNNTNNPSTNQNQDDTMDFTTCVGGIAPTSAFQRLSEANTMDFTGCVGKILSDLNENKYDELDNDTMDLTTCIGGLLEPKTTTEDTMQFTRTLPNTIMNSPVHPAVAALKLTSPSPFLVHSPLTTPRRASVEFIDSVGRPEIMNAMPGSPMVIDSHPVPLVEAPRRKTVTIDEAVPSPKRENMDDLFQSLINTDPVQPTTIVKPNGNGLVCKELLAKAGIRFMDNLTSLGRRETTGRPRESDVITPARHRYLLSAVVPEAEAVEQRCSEMVDHITNCRDDIARLEAAFLQSQAAASIESTDLEEVQSRLKTSKSVARLQARQQWYYWRAERERPLNADLSQKLSILRQELQLVTSRETDIDAVGVPLVRLRDRLASQLASIEAEERVRSSVDWELVSRLQGQCNELTNYSDELTNEMTALAQQEEELRQKLVQIQEDRRVVQRAVEVLEEERQQLSDCSDLALRELKSKMALLQALHGWHLVAVKPNYLIIEWQRHAARVQARIQLDAAEGGKVTVPAVQLLCLDGGGQDWLVRHAPSVVKVEAGRGLLKTIITLLSQLDRLHHMDRAVSRCVKAQILVSPEQPIVSVTLFNPDLKSKWSVRVRVLADRLELVEWQVEYSSGAVEEEAVRNAIDAANLASRFSQLDTLVDHLCVL